MHTVYGNNLTHLEKKILDCFNNIVDLELGEGACTRYELYQIILEFRSSLMEIKNS